MTSALANIAPRDWVKPAGIVQAEVCVPSGIRSSVSERCRSVRGEFAQEALDNHPPNWWGGEEISGAPPPPGRVPDGLSQWREYLAQEYLRQYGAPRPAPTPAPAPPRDGNDNDGDNGDGRGPDGQGPPGQRRD